MEPLGRFLLNNGKFSLDGLACEVLRRAYPSDFYWKPYESAFLFEGNRDRVEALVQHFDLPKEAFIEMTEMFAGTSGTNTEAVLILEDFFERYPCTTSGAETDTDGTSPQEATPNSKPQT